MLNEYLIGLLLKQLALISECQNEKYVREKKLESLTITLVNIVYMIAQLNDLNITNVDNDTIQILLARTELLKNQEGS
jgi:hypothetical protein